MGERSPLRSENGTKTPVELVLGKCQQTQAHGFNDVNDISISFVLGIKRSGSSHLLLTESQTGDLARFFRLPHPTTRSIPASEFESLSPIAFWDAEELTKKLASLKPKSHKGKEPYDSSQANKQYNIDGTDGIQRAAFEHGR